MFLFRHVAIQMFEILEHHANFVIVGFHLLWWHRHQDPLKLLYTPGRIHFVTHQKTIIFLLIFFPLCVCRRSYRNRRKLLSLAFRKYLRTGGVYTEQFEASSKVSDVYLLHSRFESWAGYLLLGGSLCSSQNCTSTHSRSWVSKRFMATGHTGYFGLVRR